MAQLDDFHELDEQRRYYDWIFSEHQMGADKSFKDTGVYFPNPIRKQEHKRLRKKAWTKFKAGTRFPIPSRGAEALCPALGGVFGTKL